MRTPVAVALVVLVLDRPSSAQTLPTSNVNSPGARLSLVIRDSMALLAVEHGVRVAGQMKTRRELGGPFWEDYTRSVQIPDSWDDGDHWLVNYVGHPIHGAAAGVIWTFHDPVSRDAVIGLNAHYWATRWRPLTWSAIYSVQFEVGPISEASIGNVGLRPNTIGWVDYVVTPLGGMGLNIAEDAVDRFFIRWFERHVSNSTFRAVVRSLFNPARTMANVSAGHLPWYRPSRPLKY